MASIVKPLISTRYAGSGTPIAKGQAVKIVPGSNGQNVVPCTATTDLAIGIAQSATLFQGDELEVAMPGGGAKGLAQAAIVAGDILGVNASGAIQKLAAANDRIVGIADNDANPGDLFAMMVQIAQGVATQA